MIVNKTIDLMQPADYEAFRAEIGQRQRKFRLTGCMQGALELMGRRQMGRLCVAFQGGAHCNAYTLPELVNVPYGQLSAKGWVFGTPTVRGLVGRELMRIVTSDYDLKMRRVWPHIVDLTLVGMVLSVYVAINEYSPDLEYIVTADEVLNRGLFPEKFKGFVPDLHYEPEVTAPDDPRLLDITAKVKTLFKKPKT